MLVALLLGGAGGDCLSLDAFCSCCDNVLVPDDTGVTNDDGGGGGGDY